MAKTDVVRNALKSVLPENKVWRYRAVKKAAPYCVWAEDGAVGFRSDNSTHDQGITGTVDYFTYTENDPNIARIQRAFNAFGVSWYLNTVQFEEDTKYIHYEWVWSVG